MPSQFIFGRPTPVTIGFGAISVLTGDYAGNGVEEARTVFHIADVPTPVEGGGDIDYMDCLVSGSSPAPVLAFCFILDGMAFYLLFDPLDPTGRPLLDNARMTGRVQLALLAGTRHVLCPIQGKIFSKVWASTQDREHAGRQAWVQQAETVAPALPAAFAVQLGRLTQVKNHRVVLMLPFEDTETTTGG